MKNFLIIITITAITLVGCAANTGVVKISDDTYMIAKQENSWSGATIKVKLYKKANEYCEKMGKKFIQVSNTSEDGTYGKYAGAEIQFKCQ